jgi:hypothetical protein
MDAGTYAVAYLLISGLTLATTTLPIVLRLVGKGRFKQGSLQSRQEESTFYESRPVSF